MGSTTIYPPYGGTVGGGGGGGIPEPPSGGDWSRRVVAGVGSWTRRPAFTGVDLIDADPTGTKYAALTLEHPDSYFVRLGNDAIATAVRSLSLVDNPKNLYGVLSLDNYAVPTTQKYAYNDLRIALGNGNADRIQIDAGTVQIYSEIGGIFFDATSGNNKVQSFGNLEIWNADVVLKSSMADPDLTMSRSGADPSAFNFDSNVYAPSVLADYFTAYVQMRMRDAGTGDVHNVVQFRNPGAPDGFIFSSPIGIGDPDWHVELYATDFTVVAPLLVGHLAPSNPGAGISIDTTGDLLIGGAGKARFLSSPGVVTVRFEGVVDFADYVKIGNSYGVAGQQFTTQGNAALPDWT